MPERLFCAASGDGSSETKIRRQQAAVILDSPRRRCDFMCILLELLHSISLRTSKTATILHPSRPSATRRNDFHLKRWGSGCDPYQHCLTAPFVAPLCHLYFCQTQNSLRLP